MASTSDGSRRKEKKVQYSCMEQPPLIKLLKNILSEYPDGGQILKELIQNAEDAGARTVKLLFDGRRLNDRSGEGIPEFTKFFKAPALCVYNDAEFSEDDWKGIQMIYSSVKENEKLKVGKFGLGFKSVFHITDYPCVLSGDKILLINPHRQANEVNAMMKLCDINDSEDEGLIAEDFWNALDGTFSFSRSVIESGSFPGTLFWFPLREVKSELSETLYNESKVKDLFESFECEAESLLIFMKSLEQLSLHHRTENGISDVMVVEIENAEDIVRQKRESFNKRVRLIQNNVDEDDSDCFLPMTIHMQSSNRNEKVDWYVVNYLVNNSASEKFKDMIRDTNTGKCPYVGVAVPVHKNIQGHVYCFLPLPQEGETLTGLPVHINGFFELNQSRHNLKWDTDEHVGRPTDDRYILWNKALIDEALPKAYEHLVMGAIKQMPTPPQMEDLLRVYNMLPLYRSSSNAQSRWSSLSSRLYHKLENQRVIYSQTSENWILIKDACFATFRDINACDGPTCDTTNSIIRCLQSVNKLFANIPVELFDTLCQHFGFIEDLSASKLASYLKQGSGYKTLADDDKRNILNYLLSDSVGVTVSANHLEGIELLPLDNNTWCEFRQRGSKVYLCSDDEEVKMFPGLGHKMVLKGSQLGPLLYDKLATVCSRGVYQIDKLSNAVMKSFLSEVVGQYYLPNENPVLSSTSSLNIVWLETVWKVLQKKGNIEYFDNVPLIPVLKQGMWTSCPVAELYKPGEMFLLTDCNSCNLSPELRQCFEALMVTIIPSIPNWITYGNLKKFAFEATNEGIVLLLRAISYHKSSGSGIYQFNNLPQHLTNSLKQFLISNPSIDKQTINFVKQLHMFQATQSTQDNGLRSSISESPSYMRASDLDMLPKTELPQRVIRADQDEEHLLRNFGAQLIPVTQLVQKILLSFKAKIFSNLSDSKTQIMIEFMDFVVNHFNLFGQDREIINLTQNIPFLKSGSKLHTPSQLFDPSDKDLRDLLLCQDLFPVREQEFTDQYVYVLRRLGLKSAEHLDESVILSVGMECDRLSKSEAENDVLRRKSSQMMKLLCDKPYFLSRMCMRGRSLLQSLNDLNWVPVARRPPDYPSCIPWFSDGKLVCQPSVAASMSWGLMVGAQTNIVSCDSDEICELFKWKNAPRLENIVTQLEILQKHFEQHLKSEFLHVIQKIYNFLSSQHANQLQGLQSFVAERRIIWTGKGFEIPKKVIAGHRPGDIDLKPFFYTVPEEFLHFTDTFLYLGCQHLQDNKLLSQTLHEIKKNNDAQVLSTDTLQTNRELILNVLRKLSENVKGNSNEIQQLNLLMMVENDSDFIDMQPISCCILVENDDESLEEDSDLRFVHERVPHQVAIDLGIKSAKLKTLTEAINAFQPWGQTEPLTKRIETLLKREYTFGLGVPKELIQNADDAGASVVKFMLDERTNDDAKNKLLSPAMSEFQGSALWVYNNATFSKEDLENIRLLNGGTKADDAEKIGKFGLGFCAVYNLTELPCFISGENFVIFDPQEKYLGNLCATNSPGLKVNLTNRRRRRLIKDHIDQFKPFHNVFGCIPIDPEFNGFRGTLFRFPLRTSDQAISSKLCQKPCLREDVLQLLETVMRNAGNLLLFTQHVSCVQIFHIPEEETDPSNASLIFEVNKSTEDARGILKSNVQGVLSRLHNLKRPNLSEVHRLTIEQTLFGNRTFSTSSLPYNCQSSWVVSWISQEPVTPFLVQVERSKKHIPISAIALPILENASGNIIPRQLQDISHGFYSYGYLFCFLPLPIQIEMPFHINGCFEVTSDRKRLIQCTGDEIGGSSGQDWNQQILKGSVVASFIQLLEYLANNSDANYKYYTMWPTMICGIVNDFRKKFFSTIYTTQTKLFRSLCGWHSFDEVFFLHPNIRSQAVISDAAFNMLSSFPIGMGKQIIDMPENVFQAFKECINDDKSIFAEAIISESDLIDHFLGVIHEAYWNDKISRRNNLILFALEIDDNDIINKMKNTACIPSSPVGILRKPYDLIDPESEIAKMFDISDGYFPEGGEFSEKHILAKLTSLGMMREILPKHLFIDRCHSVSAFGNTCCSCSHEQCSNVLKYLSKQIMDTDMKEDKDLIESLRQIPILPILKRPQNWSFSWAADSITASKSESCLKHIGITSEPFKVEKPIVLFKKDVGKYIGSLNLVVDEDFLRSCFSLSSTWAIYRLLCVTDIATPDLLRDQLLCFANEYKDYAQYDCLFTSYQHIYNELQQFIDQSENLETNKGKICELFCSIQKEHIVLIGKELVAPMCVAFSVKNEYLPFLCQLPASEHTRKKLYSLIGVSEYFSSEKIVDVLQIIKNNWAKNKCIDTVADMLKNLCESMNKETKVYSDLQDLKESIVAPDVTETLIPTYFLVMDDRLFFSKKQMHFLHGQIPPDVARMVGVKSKRKHVVQGFSKLMPFGQKENLATRLKGLLDDYPCDASFMKELLQNADDAKATELHFIKDFRNISPSVNESFGSNAMQPPALCVFNDGYFTDADFEGIQNLGEGSKKTDPTKTGQYGVGFNTVYHITDSPSLFTKGPGLGPRGTLCIFDPLMQVIPEYVSEEKPGIKCDVAEMDDSFPDILGYYLADQSIFAREEGTLFRLPLRNKQSDISDEVMTVAKINEYLEEMKNDLFEMLLFVKHVKKIKISSINKDNEIIEEYSVESNLSNSDGGKRTSFFANIRTDTFLPHQMIIDYQLEIVDSRGKEGNWCVVQCYGFSKTADTNSTLKEVRDNDICQLPLGAIAMPVIGKNLTKSIMETKLSDVVAVQNKQLQVLKDIIRQEINTLNEFRGKAFCFLPLKETTKLKFHYNGHFVLDRARTGICMYGVKRKWNELLLNEIVAKAWIYGMMIMKDTIGSYVNFAHNWDVVNLLTKIYHMYFPSYKKKDDNINAALTGYIYKTLDRQQDALMPVIMHKNDVTKKEQLLNAATSRALDYYFVVMWTGLANESNPFGGVFNNIDNKLKIPAYAEADNRHLIVRQIGNSLKLIGMKLIELPMSVYYSVVSFEVPAQVASPDIVAKFMLSYNRDDNGSCNIGKVNSPIKQTLLETEVNVMNLVSYITQENCQYSVIKKELKSVELLNGLPLCITMDNVLRLFDSDNPVYWSRYAHLLPQSLSCFLDTSLHNIFDMQDATKAGLIKPFAVADLQQLLPLSYNHKLMTGSTNVLWMNDKKDPFSTKFLKDLYLFLVEISKKESTYRKTQTYTYDDAFLANSTLLEQWAFIPSVRNNSDTEIFELVPISAGERVLYIDPYVNDDNICGDIMKELNVPILDTSVFKDDKKRFGFFSSDNFHRICRDLGNIVATCSKPCSFVRYLSHHKDRLAAMSASEGNVILSYFDRNIRKLGDKVYMLRDLPLFETVEGKLKELTAFSCAVVLPDDIRRDGLLIWSTKSNILLLRKTEGVANIYDKLQFSSVNNTQFYTQYLLRNVSNLPQESLMVHIECIRDTVVPRLESNSNEYLLTIHTLKNLPFIQVHGQKRKVNELFLKNDPVFHAMLDKHHFLPNEFLDGRWLNFLKPLGLNVKVSQEQLIQFATEIAANGVNHVTENTASQSKVLLQFFVDRRDFDSETLDQIKDIKFILPGKVDENLNAICAQIDSGECLVCFNGSISFSQRTLCWTTLHLLPCPEILQKECEDLGIISSPPVSAVISHCQNVCEKIHDKLLKQDINDISIIIQIFEQIYEFMFMNVKHIGEDEKHRLANTHFILVPNKTPKEMMLVKAEEVVVDIHDDDEIKPYLWRIPEEFSQFREVFLRLGSERDVRCPHYVSVLNKIKIEFPDIVPPQAMENVAKCIKGLVKLLKTEPDSSLPNSGVILYLPNRRYRLIDSKNLTISDNESFEKRLGGNCDLDFFIGFHELGINVSNPSGTFEKLPTQLRPRILTGLIKEVVSLESLEDMHCHIAFRLENFLRGPDLMQGVVRLVNNQLIAEPSVLVCDHETEITSALANIRVQRVTGLQTNIKFKEDIVPSSNKDKTCFIQQSQENDVEVFKLFFQIDKELSSERVLSKLIDEEDGLLDLIDKCTNGIMNKHTYKYLSSILREMHTPSSIKEILDEKKIDAYNLPLALRVSSFPPPGTYVPSHFFPFLERSILLFRQHEFRYIAYDIGEFNDMLDLYNEVYIYAHIIRQVGPGSSEVVGVQYEIDIGKGTTLMVQIHKLFKFVPQATETGTDLVVYDSEPIGTVAFDENCRRIRQMLIEAWSMTEDEKRRIINRLKLKWHPDKNVTKNEYANKIYNYLNYVVLELEQKGMVDDQLCHSSSDMSNSSYGSMSANVHSTGCSYAQAWKNNVDNYRQAHGGQYWHSTAPSSVCHDVGNAKRWQRQATNDFHMAQSSLTVAGPVHGYNWICYKCHQACEKSLKAAGFAKDANSVMLKSNSLSGLASPLSDENLTRLVQTLESTLGPYLGLLYPDACTQQQIPSDVITEAQAQSALELTKQVLDIVLEMID